MLKINKAIVAILLFNINLSASANEVIKKSRSGICHPPESHSYQQTKHFIAYKMLEECIASGGRLPRNMASNLPVVSEPQHAQTVKKNKQSQKPIQDFSQAKRLLTAMYKKSPDLSYTLYCGARVDWDGNRGIPDLKSIGYEIRKQPHRAQRNEYEHIMPASQIANWGQRPCWQKGGRSNCERNDEWFKVASGDAHNLQLSIGEINSDRSNFRFSEWRSRSPETFGKCEMEIDFKNRQAMPPERARGEVARANLYMSERYDINLSSQQRRLFDAWNKLYPASKSECKKEELVAEFQGNSNKFVVESCTLLRGN